jgi:hypothetical protein
MISTAWQVQTQGFWLAHSEPTSFLKVLGLNILYFRRLGKARTVMIWEYYVSTAWQMPTPGFLVFLPWPHPIPRIIRFKHFIFQAIRQSSNSTDLGILCLHSLASANPGFLVAHPHPTPLPGGNQGDQNSVAGIAHLQRGGAASLTDTGSSPAALPI